jgi:hypothetical protein
LKGREAVRKRMKKEVGKRERIASILLSEEKNG